MQENVYTRVEGNLGILVLDRPQALNALNFEMIQHIETQLTCLAQDPGIIAVAIRGSGHRAFCTGGDIRAIYHQPNLRDSLFRHEYCLNYQIQTFPKPYIAFIEGIAMGGGIGLSIYGSHRIVSETSLLAMPETNIGFFPDVGASYFLNRCEGALGTFLGLTGYRMNAADAIYAGWATHYVPQIQHNRLWHDLYHANSATAIDEAIQHYAIEPPSSKLASWQDLIDVTFSADSLAEIFEQLKKSDHPQATHWWKILKNRSPTSLAVTLTLLRRNQGLSLKEALCIEFRLSQNFMKGHDFFEGVRATLIDKDQTPHWQPASIEPITTHMIEAYFKPFEDKRLELFPLIDDNFA